MVTTKNGDGTANTRSFEEAQTMVQDVVRTVQNKDVEFWWIGIVENMWADVFIVRRDEIAAAADSFIDRLRNSNASISAVPHFDYPEKLDR